MKKTIVIISFLFFLTACQSTQNAFTLKKKSSSDEFLVEKKSPLVVPPEFGKLPTPQGNTQTIENNENNEFKDLLGNKKNNESVKVEKNENSKSIQKSILEKIQ